MNNVVNYYEKIDEDSRFSRNSRKVEFLTTKYILNEIIHQHSKILEVGCGTGAYSLHFAEQQHKVVAVDITPKHIEILREKSKQQGLSIEAYVGDATDLSRFDSDKFDIVLCLGPMYHLTNKEDQNRCISESLRVLKSGGYLAVAYINKYSIIPMLATRDAKWIRNSVIDKVLNEGTIFEGDDDCFWTDAYFTYPDEIESLLGQYDITTVEHVGTDGITHTIHEYVDKLNESEFESWTDYHIQTCRERSILGMSSHGLYICRKNRK